jgi:hypothetical protein
MRTYRILPAVLAVLLPACSGEDLPTAVHDLDALNSAAAVERTIKGSCTTTFPPAPWPLPAVLEQTDTGTCQLSHLGRSDIFSIKEIHFATGTQITTQLRITAANGDVLTGTGIGANQPAGPGLVGFTAVMTISGGTGRFAGASGSLDVSGVANLMTNTASLEMEGRVTY